MSHSVKIVRSRTATKRTQSSHSELGKAFAFLREIDSQEPGETSSRTTTQTKRKPGRPKSSTKSLDPSSPSTSSASPPKKKKKEPKPSKIKPNKTAKGKRKLPVGGGELQSEIVVDVNTEVSTRSVQTTCEPIMKDAAAQVIRCQKCDDLGHIAILCSGVSSTERPPPFFCHQCKVSYKYSSSTQMTTTIQLCSAHRLEAEETTKRKEKAERILKRVAALTSAGSSLSNAIKLVGLNEQSYNKIRVLYDL